MENTNIPEQDFDIGNLHPVKGDAFLNMAAVILFYVVVFVAFSVFAG